MSDININIDKNNDEPVSNEEVFFESRRSAIRTLGIFMGLSLLGILFAAMGDESGLGFLAFGVLAVIAFPMILIIRASITNKKVPLFKVDSVGITIRPTRHDDTITLTWDQVEQINVLKLSTKHNANFMFIHPQNPVAIIEKAPKKTVKKLKKFYKLSGTPFSEKLDGFNADALEKLTAAIKRFSGQTVSMLPSLKYQENYREVVRANDGKPPTVSTFAVAASQAKRPKEIMKGIIIGISIAALWLIGSLIFIL